MSAHTVASLIIALCSAPIETLNCLIVKCEDYEINTIIDIMNLESSLSVLRVLKKIPPILSILHHRNDKEKFNKEK